MIPWSREALSLFVSLGTALSTAYLTWYSGAYVKGPFVMGKYTSGLQILLWILMLWAPVGMAVTSLQHLAAFVRGLVDDGAWIAPTVRDGEAEGGYEVIGGASTCCSR